MLRVMGRSGLYREPTGFAAARTEVRAFNVVMIPALAIETVCCSWTVASVSEVSHSICTYHHFMEDATSSI